MIGSPVSPTGWSAISLRDACFTSTELWNSERVGALVLYCSDGHWGDAFDEFCHRRLRLPRARSARSTRRPSAQ